MNILVKEVNGHWFAYMEHRVLGPFKTAGQAWAAVHREMDVELKQDEE